MKDAQREAEALLARLAAARDLRASCERFGLLGHEVAAFAESALAEVHADAESFLVRQFDRILALSCKAKRGEDANWRALSARELAGAAAQDDLESALRDLGRLRAAAETLVARKPSKPR